MWTAGRLESKRTRATNSVVATDPAASRSTFRASLSNAFSSTALNFSAGARACFALSPRFACVFWGGSRRRRLGGRSLVGDPRYARQWATARRGPADGSKLGEGRPPGPQQRTPKTYLVARAVHPAVRGRRRRAVERPELDAELVPRLRRWRVVLRHRDGSGLDRRSLPAPNPAFVSDDEGPIQECQTFHLDIASYCGLDDDCPVTAPSPRCERDATRTKTQKQKGRGKRARSADVRSARAMAASSKRHHATTSASASLCAAARLRGNQRVERPRETTPRRQADVGKRSGASSA